MKKSFCILTAMVFMSSFASAVIQYSDQSGLTVDFTNIQEDNQGLFGAPVVSGDTLYFFPTDFKVSAVGAGGFDYLDGTLQVTLDAKDGYDIDSIELEEFGDYYLTDILGSGTIGTQVQVVAQAQILIMEVDGTAVTPILVPGLAVYKPVGGVYDLINYGPGVYAYDEMLWEAEVKFDIDAVLLANGYLANEKATLVNFSLDNKLYAFSENGTVAQIAKKGSYIVALTVPEPATVMLLGLGVLALRRKK